MRYVRHQLQARETCFRFGRGEVGELEECSSGLRRCWIGEVLEEVVNVVNMTGG